ncbi:heme/hemin ABC transporter substrate-binding protein [Taklimakanibacter lacteus]|uniref:heme/hemin ABC transporter substrate-binding protein n=1 Tax=Taklimakanibacter lacteus TaxID=2268456 RepID=UPI000E674A68
MLLLVALMPQAGAQTVIDAAGREVEIGPAQRIMTLGSDVTEIVHALGAGKRVVAVDRGSRYPAETLAKPNVGYRRALSSEGVLALAPDLIIASEDIGPPPVVEVLKTTAIPLLLVPEDNTLEGIERKIALVAGALKLEEEGKRLTQSVRDDFAAATRLTAAIPPVKRKKVVFFHGLTRLSAAGAGTAANAIITYAGGINPMSAMQGYKAASEEYLLEAAPDAILLMSDGKGGPTADHVFAIPALKPTPAAKNGALIVLDGPYMIGFGPRTAQAVRDLATALYPEVGD